jgi:hypothetical protein
LGTAGLGHPFDCLFDWQNKDPQSSLAAHQAALDVAKQPNSGVEYTHLTALNHNYATVGRSLD